MTNYTGEERLVELPYSEENVKNEH